MKIAVKISGIAMPALAGIVGQYAQKRKAALFEERQSLGFIYPFSRYDLAGNAF